jgi:hypothetical protein
MNWAINTTFIEPYPDLLMSLLKDKDHARIRVISKRLQDVSLNEFAKLQKNDMLFIDSTHVAKLGSDVNYIFFDILPSLNPGVYVHIHDIMFPFEYPKQWIDEKRAWNEAYMLRTFLEYNSRFEIIFMNSFLQRFHKGFFQKRMPLCLKNPGGSIWIKS